MVQAQNHPWMLEHISSPVATVPESILVAMREFGKYNRLKKAALTAVAYHLNNVSAWRTGQRRTT